MKYKVVAPTKKGIIKNKKIKKITNRFGFKFGFGIILKFLSEIFS